MISGNSARDRTKTGRCGTCRNTAHPPSFTIESIASFAHVHRETLTAWIARQNVWLQRHDDETAAWQKLKDEANAGAPLYIVRSGVAYLFTAVPPTCDAEGETWDGCIASAWVVDRLILVARTYRRDEHLAARKARRAAENEPAPKHPLRS